MPALHHLANDFQYRDEREPHHLRTRAILAEHPEVRALIGRNPMTALIMLGIVTAQMLMAWWLRDAAWWVIGLAAFGIGAFASHALFVVIHECTHQLVFPKRAANLATAIAANLPQLFPSAVSFTHYHLRHHSHQGEYELDADLPSRWEARLINQYAIGRALWLALFPVFQILRVPRLRAIAVVDRWVVLNWLVQIAFNVAVWQLLGARAFAYLGVSFLFSIGLHPLGARWIQEHYLAHGTQETYSYYGPLNRLALNVGFHNEHHDFPSVPWNRLPALKATAPSAYDTLVAHTSWTRLLLRFLFDQELSLFSRMVRRVRVS
ncbi:MAG: hypothetical protein RLZZ621_1669 [Gemmatimonadota bacterium]